MSYQGKGFGLSLLIHLLGFMLIVSLSTVERGRKTIVIDFNIMAGAPRKATPRKTARTSFPKQKRQEDVRKLNEVKQEPVPEPAPQQESVQKEIVPEIAEEPIPQNADAEHREGPAAGESSSDEEGPSLDPEGDYIHAQFDFIREAVQRNLAYPQLARRMGWAGKVTVSFIICRDGVARKIEIIKSSGYPVLDRDALKTIEKSLPFPVPPVEAKVILPVVYRLN